MDRLETAKARVIEEWNRGGSVLIAILFWIAIITAITLADDNLKDVLQTSAFIVQAFFAAALWRLGTSQQKFSETVAATQSRQQERALRAEMLSDRTAAWTRMQKAIRACFNYTIEADALNIEFNSAMSGMKYLFSDVVYGKLLELDNVVYEFAVAQDPEWNGSPVLLNPRELSEGEKETVRKWRSKMREIDREITDAVMEEMEVHRA